MDWLSQNWGWIVLLVGGYFLMTRMGMGGCGMGMSHAHGHNHGGGHGGSADDGHNHGGPAELFDPVSQRMLPAQTAIASVHQGQVYYFEDRANRDAFEAEPEKYLAGMQAAGRRGSAAGDSSRPAHQGHGCC